MHLLDEISKSLPDRLWLSELTQTGSDFAISGMTDSLTAVSDFVANLESTHVVQEAGGDRRQPGARRTPRRGT